MRRPEIYIIIIIASAIILLLVYQYVFSIYEVTFSVKPKELYADNLSTVTIAVVPLNSLGWEAPFRSSPASFELVEGKDLVEIVSADEKNGTLVLKAKSTPGMVVVHVKSKNALLPSPIEIPINPNIASR